MANFTLAMAMNLYRCVLCILMAVFSLLMSAQRLSLKQEAFIRKTISDQYGQMSSSTPLGLGRANFCAVNKDTFFNPAGVHYVFKLRGDSAERMDHCVWHGSNFDRYLFEWQNTLYALGGYGFFTTNNNLQYFNAQLKEWSFKATQGSVPPFIHGIAFKTGHFVYSFNNYKSGNSAAQDIQDTFLYRLNLETMLWEKGVLADAVPRISGTCYYLENYCFQPGRVYSLLIKPKEASYVVVKSEEAGFVNSTQIMGVDKDKLIKTSEATSGLKTITDTLDMGELWKKYATSAARIELVPISATEKPTVSSWALMVVGVLAAGGGWLWAFRKKKLSRVESENKSVPLETEGSDIFNTLMANPKLVLSTEELDELIGIGHLELDSRKLRRHRLLSALDKDHPDFIVREKEKNDKRRFIYRLNKESLTLAKS